MLFQYTCKKTGQVVDIDTATLPTISTDYALGRGLREYFDNYHASVTVKEHGAEKCAELVAPMVDEALARIRAGDVPGARAPADPGMARVRAAVREAGVDLTKIDPVKLVAFLKRQAETGRAA